MEDVDTHRKQTNPLHCVVVSGQVGRLSDHRSGIETETALITTGSSGHSSNKKAIDMSFSLLKYNAVPCTQASVVLLGAVPVSSRS